MNVRLQSLAIRALVFGALLFCILPTQVVAEGAFSPLPVRLAELSMDKAAKKIRKQTKGKILSSKKINKRGQMLYQFKVLLPNGKVKILTVDPDKG